MQQQQQQQEERTCSTCRFVLDEVQTPTGTSWRHARPWLDDHVPQPVPASTLPPLRICDFCGDTPISWRYPCADFLVGPSDAGLEYSRGDWAACHLCHGLILTEQWFELAKRSLTSAKDYQRKTGLHVLDVGESLLFMSSAITLHEAFRSSRRGPARQVND